MEKFNISLIDKLKYLDIVEILITLFYIFAKDKNNKLFSLTLNKIIF